MPALVALQQLGLTLFGWDSLGKLFRAYDSLGKLEPSPQVHCVAGDLALASSTTILTRGFPLS